MEITRLSLAVLLLFGAAGCSSTGHGHGPHGHSHASGGHGHSHGAHGHAHGPGGHTHGAAVAAAPERIDLGKLRAKADAPGKTLRGQIEAAMEAHDFLKVVALVDRFRADEPRDVWSGLMAADALVELGRYVEATDELQRVLNLKPCSAAYLRAGYLLHVRGQSSAGEEILTLALEPGTRAAARAFALHERGRLRWFRGSLASAEADFRAALKLDPRSRQARVGLARVLAARGERDLAAAELERAASTPRLWGELALLQRARGRTAEAAHALKTARRLAAADPHHWERSLAVVLADHAIVGAPGIDTAEAVRLARRELTRRGSVEGWDALAWALTADGKPAKAYAAAKRALVHGTQEPLLFFHAGVAAARAGKADDAKRWLRHALSLNTTFHPVFPAIARDLLAKLEA